DFPNLLYARILFSPHAHANIRSIDTSDALKLPGVHAALTYKDLPRIAHTTAGQGAPEPSPYDTFLLDKKARFIGDRVALVAAESPEIADKAVSLIHVEYELLPEVFDPEEAMKPGAPVIHDEKEAHAVIPVPYFPEKNIAAQSSFSIGDVEKGLSDSDFIFDNIYESHYATHTSMEPHIVITWLDENGRLIIRTSTQVPFHVRRIIALCLDLPVSRIRVIKPRIGGAFGGKQEVLLEGLCAALTIKTGCPVKLAYSREEEFISSRTRHPQKIRMRSGVNKNGDITAIDLQVLMNTGAYGSHALTVLCNTGSKTLPLYRCPNISFQGTTVYTNLPVGGAYRGYGATQGYVAMGIQMDEMAHAIGMDPVDFHKRNHIRVGEGSPVFQALGEGREGVEMILDTCGLDECIDLGAREIGWKSKRGKPGHGPVKRGFGMVCLMQGSGIPEIDMGAATIKLNEDGSFNLLVGATDLGTGSDTVLAQIAAEVLTVPLTKIIVYSSDTDMTPFDVGAYASSTTYLSGMAVKKAAEKVKTQIISVAAELLKVKPSDIHLEKEHARCGEKKVSLSRIAHYSLYESNQFQIMDSASHFSHKSPPPFSAHFTEVSVDTMTGQIKVVKYVAAVDCGTAINPVLAKGQTDGAVLNGISFALTERYIFDQRGRMLNPNFNYYKIFSMRDLPEIKTILVPTYEPTGPFGAKSVSEISVNGPIPAISNAVFDAVGVRLRKSPFTPDVVLDALKKQASSP
ncbi:molybdopterin-dependent oxidoreductase, partial [Candidatus Sumerlaeota bacterium]|nr:molybdopterin-dependent oxidoreductase [Candidatus Sumerlaeota bacterium]